MPREKRFFLRNWDSSLVKNSRAEIYSLPDDVIHSISDNFKSTLVCRAIYQSAGKYEVSNKSITFLAIYTFQLSNSLALTVGLLTLPYFEATHQLKQVRLLVLFFQCITSWHICQLKLLCFTTSHQINVVKQVICGFIFVLVAPKGRMLTVLISSAADLKNISHDFHF